MLRLRVLTFDAVDPRAQAAFWAAALGWECNDVRGEVGVLPPADSPWDVHLLFMPVEEPRTVKNRCHPDLHTDDLDSEVARLVGLGATVQVWRQEQSRWAVLTDPDGNEFCVVQPAAQFAR